MKPTTLRPQRFFILGVALATMIALGVRVPTGNASPWERASFGGEARAALTVETIVTADEEEALPTKVEVFARAAYSTELSRYERGVLVRTSFPIPRTDDVGVLIVDLDRQRSRALWRGDDQRHLRARFYVVAPSTGATFFDAAADAGELTLDTIVTRGDQIGFRLRGWLDFVDQGPDQALGSGDDLSTSIEIAFETLPPPEELTQEAQDPAPLPGVGVCEWPDCYEDPGYYYAPYPYEGAACGDPAYSYDYYSDDYEGGAYEDDGSGCDSDPPVDEWGEPLGNDPYADGLSDYGDYDPLEGGDDSGYGGGCEGDTLDDDPGASEGCDGGGDGFDDSGSSSGCDGGDSASSEGAGCSGDSSCEGDTLSAAPPRGAKRRLISGAAGWGPILILFGLVLGIHRRP